jgi:G3E family GTPase
MDIAPLPTASVPVTIITGFLGAGKTTLLRHVLSSPHGLKIAVIQNELSAAAGLEASTMRGPDGEEFAQWLELANGCVCCEVRDELAKGIERLMELKGAFDYVIVETTGMADPGPVAENFWLDAELESPLRLDGIVAVVDAAHFEMHAHEMEACRQVGSADVILLNKVDTLETPHAADQHEQLAQRQPAAQQQAAGRLQRQLRVLNSLAPILTTTRSVVPLERILNLNAFGNATTGGATRSAALAATPFAFARKQATTSTISPEVAAMRAAVASQGTMSYTSGSITQATILEPSSASSILAAADSCEPCADGPRKWLHKDGSFGAITLELDGAMERASLDQFFATLFWEPEGEPPPEVYRAKGVLDVADSDYMHALQAVHATYEFVEAATWAELGGIERRNKLVFIGRNLDRGALLRGLEACKEM